MKTLKQSVGIDISQETFTACICSKKHDETLNFSTVEKFTNDKPGYNRFLRWIRSELKDHTDLVFLMEATGVYYENLAHHLHKLKKTVHVVLPNTSKHYFSSLNIKTKTDAVDARILSQFGVERKHAIWNPPAPVLLHLRNLTRYYVQLQEQKTALGNIFHSKDASYDVQGFILKSNQKLIDAIDKQIELCKDQIHTLITNDVQISAKVKKLLTIKGVGEMTIATIIAETLGFEHVNSAKQLVSYAGYDVVQRESGTSILGKTRISKKGNRYIRNAQYFPAMVATRFNPILKENYLRIIKNKPSKMVGQVAIQRKLLVLIYTLWKNDTEFDPQHKKSNLNPKVEATLDRSA